MMIKIDEAIKLRAIENLTKNLVVLRMMLHLSQSDLAELIGVGRQTLLAIENRKRRGEKKPETFDFLGFTFYCSTSKRGYFRAKCITSKKKMRAKIQESKEWMKKRMHCKVSETIRLLNIKLMGHYKYYGITDNTKGLRQFYETIIWRLYRTLNRRTQRNKYNFHEYYEKIGKYIIRPKINIG